MPRKRGRRTGSVGCASHCRGERPRPPTASTSDATTISTSTSTSDSCGGHHSGGIREVSTHDSSQPEGRRARCLPAALPIFVSRPPIDIACTMYWSGTYFVASTASNIFLGFAPFGSSYVPVPGVSGMRRLAVRRFVLSYASQPDLTNTR
ncbi:hypothetical protein BV20DRAFT_372437 [Pilatotrama ljubarskyi]|nr:hypothetical protein BV20DRAFT_372437 [Pilatotrama ljubarskyi]